MQKFRPVSLLAAVVLLTAPDFIIHRAVAQPQVSEPTIGPAAVAEARPPNRTARLPTPSEPIAIGDEMVVDLRSPELWFQQLVDRQILDDPREIKEPALLAMRESRTKQAAAQTDPQRKQLEIQEIERWWKQVKENRWRNQFEEWLTSMFLIIDGRPFKDLKPLWVDPWPWDEFTGGDAAIEQIKFARYYTLRFQLRKTDASRDTWMQLLRGAGVKDRPVTISVGFLRGGATDRVIEMRTEVSPTASKPWQRISIEVAPFRKLGASALMLLILAGLLVWMAVSSNLLRDTGAPLKPSGRHPFSLGLCQMAFWLILVGSAWLFIWVITGEYNTLTDSELALIGITATTGLGAVLINQVAPPNRPSALSPAESQERGTVRLRELRIAAEAEVIARQTALASQRAVTTTARVGVLDRTRQQAEVDLELDKEKKAQLELDRQEHRVAELRDREDFFKPSGQFRSFFLDLLRERQSVSFHRFQMLAWTLLMGLIFVFSVFADLAMPKFNTTLLLLLGLSNGTYLGFKLPEARKEA